MRAIKFSKPIIIGIIIVSIAVLVLLALTLAVEGVEDVTTIIISVIAYVLATSSIIYFCSYLINIKLEHQLYDVTKGYKDSKSTYMFLIERNYSLSETICDLKQLKDNYKNKLDILVKEHNVLIEKYNALLVRDSLKASKIKELSEIIKSNIHDKTRYFNNATKENN